MYCPHPSPPSLRRDPFTLYLTSTKTHVPLPPTTPQSVKAKSDFVSWACDVLGRLRVWTTHNALGVSPSCLGLAPGLCFLASGLGGALWKFGLGRRAPTCRLGVPFLVVAGLDACSASAAGQVVPRGRELSTSTTLMQSSIGPCVVQDNCVCSSNYEGGACDATSDRSGTYGNHEMCTVTFVRPMFRSTLSVKIGRASCRERV